jgi:uncharacterized protein YeaO (DUF488 family)
VAVRIVQLGSARGPGEGLRIGTVRRPPRGVPKAEYARQNYYDVWLPDLAPSAALFATVKAAPSTGRNWTTFARRYEREMREPPAQRLIALLAALSKTADFSVGCYCDDERRCHRSLLRKLLSEAGAEVRS